MNFKEIENIENQVASYETTANSSYQSIMLAEYLEKEKRKRGAKENPFVYFYEDVILSSLEFNFQLAIGEILYKSASHDALACLALCTEFKKLSNWDVSGWLVNALKFTDNIVLHYIQEVCKEIPGKYKDSGIEKARYIQLSLKVDKEVSIAGAELINLYDLRNDLEHRTKTYSDGHQELICPKRNKIRNVVLKLYPDAMKRILNTYRTTLPNYINEN